MDLSIGGILFALIGLLVGTIANAIEIKRLRNKLNEVIDGYNKRLKEKH